MSKKILVIEDDKVLLNVVRDKLSSEGFQVLGASNGEEGLKMALDSHPDLILCDVMMPIMDGMQMVTELRKDSWGKDAQVIILTNVNENEKIADFLEKGAYDYLIKSNWSLDEVARRVKEKLGI